jgi:hypothetical protein
MRISLGIALFVFATNASAQNLRDVPMGGTTAVMGGATIGAGSDSASPYMNPAGVAANPQTDIASVSASLYALGISDVGSYFVLRGSILPSERSRSKKRALASSKFA